MCPHHVSRRFHLSNQAPRCKCDQRADTWEVSFIVTSGYVLWAFLVNLATRDTFIPRGKATALWYNALIDALVRPATGVDCWVAPASIPETFEQLRDAGVLGTRNLENAGTSELTEEVRVNADALHQLN